ncbi:MAG: zf-TFIIB domain-containing protein [bacterium]|nr:zf-TFIIB domain-containing protein [bacterium]
MQCPNGDGELKPAHFKGVALFECHTCKGLWFTQEEMNKAKNNRDDNLRWLNFDLFEEKGKKYVNSQGSKNCPKNNVAMSSLVYQESGVRIDKCDKCHSIWLDDGEFQKIIEYLEKIVITENASVYAKDTLKKLLDVRSNHEDKISEIKDFLTVSKLLEERVLAEHPKLEEIVRTATIEWAMLTGL